GGQRGDHQHWRGGRPGGACRPRRRGGAVASRRRGLRRLLPPHERGRRIMRGIERADSVTLDPHKGLFLPYGTGALVVRDGGALRRAHGMHADYLPALPQENDLIDFSEVSPELSRPFRGLRVWLPLKMLGLAPFRRAL